MYQIIASDLDGTLLTPDHIVADYSKAVLRKLHKQGKHIVLATGRHHNNVAEISKDIGIPAYMVTSNGSRIHTPDQELLFSADLDTKLLYEVIHFLHVDPTLYISIFYGDNWAVNRENKEIRVLYEKNLFQFNYYQLDHLPTAAMKISIMQNDYNSLDQSTLYHYEEKLRQHFGDELSIMFSSFNYLEILPKGITKGSSLKRLAEYLGHNMTHCIAFGDDMNDVEMLNSVGRGLVMGSASDRVKSNLPHLEVIGHCSDESVARYLDTLLLED